MPTLKTAGVFLGGFVLSFSVMIVIYMVVGHGPASVAHDRQRNFMRDLERETAYVTEVRAMEGKARADALRLKRAIEQFEVRLPCELNPALESAAILAAVKAAGVEQVTVDAGGDPVARDFFVERPFPVSLSGTTRRSYLESINRIQDSPGVRAVKHGTIPYANDDPFDARFTVTAYTGICEPETPPQRRLQP